MKKEMNLGRRLKGLLCVMLSLIMMFGMTLGVNAAETTYNLIAYYDGIDDNSIKVGFYFYNGGLVQNGHVIQAGESIGILTSGGGTVDIFVNGEEKTIEGDSFIVPATFPTYHFVNRTSSNDIVSELYLTGITSTEESTGGSHVHIYEWKTETEPTETQDGEEVCICECGDISARQPLSAMGAYWNSIIDKVKKAKAGDTISFSSETWNSFPKRVMDAIAARRDITVEISFSYQGKMWKVVVPANAAIDNSCDWYGPEKLGQMFGKEEIVK